LLYSLRDKYKRWAFARDCKGVLATPPIELDPRSAVMMYTQLQHKDVLMGLIAFKSFASRVAVGSVRILDDGSLDAGDKTLLREHLPGVEFLELSAVRNDTCPRGGCWERLLWIARLTRDHFVVQLDSDTLTVGPLPEVAACLAESRSFVIGTWDNQTAETMEFRHGEAVRHLAKVAGKPHIQLLAEANFDKLERFHELSYIRGCAGFAGFAMGSVDTEFIEAVSRQMKSAIGEAWSEWGSEQLMSNIVVANDPRAVVLPHPKYCDCTKLKPDAAFVHFIGSCRFTGGVYARMARLVIAGLQQ
jgi:hypothetical protein